MFFKKLTLPKVLPYILIFVGVVGYICAFIIMHDKLKLLENPNFKPSCSINPILSCGNIMQSAQATAFGNIPNPFLGLGGFPMVAVIGAAMLAGGRFKRWFWLATNAGLLFAVGFCHWLFFESVYRIQALCIYCMIVWTVTILGFWYVTLYNLDNGHLRLPKGKATRVYGWVRRHHLDILVLWYLIIIGLILNHFWYYFGPN